MWISATIGELDARWPGEYGLARGEHAGHRWLVMHNGLGHLCGYVRIPAGHPWTRRLPPGRDDADVGRMALVDPEGRAMADGWAWDGTIPAEVHGSVDWGCRAPDGGWWLGFHAGHAWDLPDLDLPMSAGVRAAMAEVAGIRETHPEAARFFGMEVRGQAYMEGQCRSLCEQAAAAAGGDGR